jgi:hypothetical protein
MTDITGIVVPFLAGEVPYLTAQYGDWVTGSGVLYGEFYGVYSDSPEYFGFTIVFNKHSLPFPEVKRSTVRLINNEWVTSPRLLHLQEVYGNNFTFVKFLRATLPHETCYWGFCFLNRAFR